MASIRKEITIEAAPEDVWAAVRDFGAVHERLVPGFVVDAQLDGEDRVVTFYTGLVLRELLVDLDDEARRLVWAAVGGQLSHHNSSAQIFPDGNGGSRFVWITDVLPHEAARPVSELMERGIAVAKKTLEHRSG